MIIDLHVYTRPSGGPTLADAIKNAENAGVDAILVADKGASEGVARELAALDDTSKVKVFLGVEIPTADGDAVIVVPEIDPFLSREEWRQLTTLGTPTFEEVTTLVEALGGAVLLTQPYERERAAAPRDRMFALEGIAGVQIANGTSNKNENKLATEAVAKSSLSGFGGSAQLGSRPNMRWLTLFADAPQTQAELCDALRTGDFWALEVLGNVGPASRDSRRRDGGRRDGGRRDGGRRDGGRRDGGRRDGGQRGRGPRR